MQKTHFKALFGIDSSEIKETCILMPFAQKDALKEFGMRSFSRGKLFGAGSNRYFSVIHTGIGPAFTGDSVLYLKDTPCRNSILFGSCGLVNEKEGLSIGSLTTPYECYAYESFSQMLSQKKAERGVFYPDQGLFAKLRAFDKKIHKVACATVGSLKLEEECKDIFIEKRIDALDMECSAFFAAAGDTKLQAVALFYVSDIIGTKPFYGQRDSFEKAQVALARRDAAGLLCEFIKKNISA